MVDFKIQLERVKLNKEIEACRLCPGLNIPKDTMSASGAGVLNAELMIVGQSLHGFNKNTPIQIPFIGPVESKDSGKILYEALERAGFGFKQKNIFITNVVHCHTPNNRSSTEKEIMNCKSFLQRELELVKPKMLLTLGSNARDWFTLSRIQPGFFVSAYKNYNLNFPYINSIIISVHPSYIQRYGNQHRAKYIQQLVDSLNLAKSFKVVK